MVTKRKCQAADEATCPHHGEPVQSAPNFDAGLEKHLTEQAALTRVMGARNTVTSAMESSLTYQGEKPSWWKEYQETSLNDAELPSKTELMDVVDSPMGKLAVVWEEQSQDDVDRDVTLDSGMGVNVCKYKSFETGETVGHVSLTHMSDDSVERSFGNDEFTPFRWQDRYSGSSYGFRYDDEMKTLFEGEMTEEKKILIRRKLWVSVHKAERVSVPDGDGKYTESYNLTEKNLPDDKTVKADLRKFANRFNKVTKEKRAYYATPYVDYSEVNNELKGKGFGAGIYVYAARKLGERGQVLRGSGLQSDSAQSLWNKFAKNLPANTSTISLTYDKQKSDSPVLDFRAKS